MRVRHFVIAFLILACCPVLYFEGERGYAAWLLRRGDFDRLERLDSDAYFWPAVRAYTRRPQHSDALMGWATRRLQPLIPDYDIYDLAVLQSGTLIAGLGLKLDARILGNKAWRRLIAIDSREFAVIAEQDLLQFNDVSGLELRLSDLDGDGREEVLVNSFGTGVYGRLFRITEGRFEQIRSEDPEGDFSSWAGFEFVDLDHDGILQIRGYLRQGMTCACGKESQADEVTWKMEERHYRKWTIKGEECGPTCERPWTR